MKKYALLVGTFFLMTTFCAAEKVVVMQMPESVRYYAETETNIAFSVEASHDNKWMLTIELDLSASNCVETVFGEDKDNDGVLDLEEGEFCIGWDCSEWFWYSRNSDIGCGSRGEGENDKLRWSVELSKSKRVCHIVGNVFEVEVPQTLFGLNWNMMRVVSRGASRVCVSSKISPTGLRFVIR